MSAPDPARGIPGIPLLVVIDPVARLTDGESVRIARDVLCAGTPGVKVCLPDDPDDTARALARRGSRRPVLVGNDRALLRVVRLLHREGALQDAALAVVPVGNGSSVALVRSLGVPRDAVSAARAVLSGAEHGLDLLVDDGGGIVLGGIRIPAAAAGPRRVPGGGGEPGFGGEPGSGGEPGFGDEPVFGEGAGFAAGGGGAGFGAEPEGGPRRDGPFPRSGARVPRQRTGAEAAGETAGSPLRRACRSVVRTVLPRGLRVRRGAARGRRRVARGGSSGAGIEPHAGTPQAARSPGEPGTPPEPGVPPGPGEPRGRRAPSPAPQRLRVEADGKLLADLDEPVGEVSVRTTHDGGLAEVTVQPLTDPSPVRAMARAVTVSGGADFRYRTATARVDGPVTTRTWTVLPRAWRLVLPAGDGPGADS